MLPTSSHSSMRLRQVACTSASSFSGKASSVGFLSWRKRAPMEAVCEREAATVTSRTAGDSCPRLTPSKSSHSGPHSWAGPHCTCHLFCSPCGARHRSVLGPGVRAVSGRPGSPWVPPSPGHAPHLLRVRPTPKFLTRTDFTLSPVWWEESPCAPWALWRDRTNPPLVRDSPACVRVLCESHGSTVSLRAHGPWGHPTQPHLSAGGTSDGGLWPQGGHPGEATLPVGAKAEAGVQVEGQKGHWPLDGVRGPSAGRLGAGAEQSSCARPSAVGLLRRPESQNPHELQEEPM